MAMIQVIFSILLFSSMSSAQWESSFNQNSWAASNSNPTWLIQRTEWTERDEQKFSDFVAIIGNLVETRKCRSLDQCLKHPANPYRGTDPSSLVVFADCSRLPYVLRAYFAWKNQLPFSFSTSVKARDIEGNTSTDIRYSRFGNEVTSRRDVIQKNPRSPLLALQQIQTVIDSVSSAHFRMNYQGNDTGLFSDFYPVRLDRNGVRPGTIIYDPNGHVALVSRISDDGRIFYIDSHPDNSITFGMYGTKFVRSHPGQGAGFKNFRPLRLVNAQQNADGSYVGGFIQAVPNRQLPLYSVEQFFGSEGQTLADTEWKKGQFLFNGQSFGFYDFLRQRLAKTNFKENPLEEIRSLTEDLCYATQDRVFAVEDAIKAKIHLKPAPERLPYNIYGTSGEWEAYSTPSRDARLKTSFKELRDLAQTLVEGFQRHPENYLYQGSDLKIDLLNAYLEKAQACRFSYTNSQGQRVALNLETVRTRLFDLSFDPYQCIERRWGAQGQELSSCQDDSRKNFWYERQRWLRNQVDRRYDVRMDYSPEELTGPLPGVGERQAPDVDVVGYLRSR